MDLKTLLKDYLVEYNLTGEEFELIYRELKPMLIKKGEDFCIKGKTCKQLGILFNGLLYAFYETKDLKEQVSRFYYFPNNPIVCDFESFSLNKPSNETIRAIEDSYVMTINNIELLRLYKEIPKMNLIGRQIAEFSYIQALQRIHSLQALTPEDRVRKLFSEQSNLFNRVKRQHLASYLRMNRNLITKCLKSIKN